MKRKFRFIIVFSLFAVFISFSCGNKDRESGSKNDTVKTEMPPVSEKKDSAGDTNRETLEMENEVTDVLSNQNNRKDTSSVKREKKDKIKIIAYYFHPTARCPSCINIENFTEEVIKTQFAKENKAGLISFRQFNIEDSVNEHYIEDYKLEFSSVILAKYVNNKQVKWKNLEHVWKYSGDKESFFKYLKIEVEGFLKEKEGT